MVQLEEKTEVQEEVEVMEPSDYLKKGWCQGAMAMGEDGHHLDIFSEEAVSWCLSGAIQRCYVMDNVIEWTKYQDILKKELGLRETVVGENFKEAYTTTGWNDTLSRTQEEVINMALKVEAQMK